MRSVATSLLVGVGLGLIAAVHASPLVAQTGETTTVVGVLEGDSREVFGKIHAVAPDLEDGVFVLDQQALTVSWFSRGGDFRARIGGIGDGPGEFRTPEALTVSEDRHLHVLDRQLSRITIYSLEDGGVALSGTVPVPMFGSANALCRQDDSYLVLGIHEGEVVHQLTDDGTLVGSFGESLARVPADLAANFEGPMQRAASVGHLLCHGSDLVVVALEQLPTVRAFTPDGRLLWRTDLPGFRQLRWEAIGGGRGRRAQADPETGTFHSVMGIGLFGPDTLAVSMVERIARDSTRAELRLLDLHTGVQIGREEVASVLAATTGATDYWYRNEPFPQVTLTPHRSRR